MKKLLVAVISILMIVGAVMPMASASEGAGQVYYLNFKPEQDQQWQDLAKVYTDETGIPITDTISSCAVALMIFISASMAASRNSLRANLRIPAELLPHSVHHTL